MNYSYININTYSNKELSSHKWAQHYKTLRYALDYSGYFEENILAYAYLGQHKQRFVTEEHLWVLIIVD